MDDLARLIVLITRTHPEVIGIGVAIFAIVGGIAYAMTPKGYDGQVDWNEVNENGKGVLGCGCLLLVVGAIVVSCLGGCAVYFALNK